jgi:GDP-D-mannose dehydratase
VHDLDQRRRLAGLHRPANGADHLGAVAIVAIGAGQPVEGLLVAARGAVKVLGHGWVLSIDPGCRFYCASGVRQFGGDAPMMGAIAGVPTSPAGTPTYTDGVIIRRRSITCEALT